MSRADKGAFGRRTRRRISEHIADIHDAPTPVARFQALPKTTFTPAPSFDTAVQIVMNLAEQWGAVADWAEVHSLAQAYRAGAQWGAMKADVAARARKRYPSLCGDPGEAVPMTLGGRR